MNTINTGDEYMFNFENNKKYDAKIRISNQHDIKNEAEEQQK